MNGSNIRRFLLGSLVALICVVSLPAAVLANPVPLLYPLTPSAALPGSPSFTQTVRGAGFVSGSTVTWDGLTLATTFISSSILTATVTAADLVVPNTAVVTVVSPAPGGAAFARQYRKDPRRASELALKVLGVLF